MILQHIGVGARHSTCGSCAMKVKLLNGTMNVTLILYDHGVTWGSEVFEENNVVVVWLSG